MTNHVAAPRKNKSSTRIDHLDLLKALAIYFVIIYHFNNIPIDVIEAESGWNYINLYFTSIFSTCVPILFFVHGLLLLNKNEIDIIEHIKRIFILLTLTVLWGFITLVSLSYIWGEELSLSQIIHGVWFIKQGWNGHLWFLYALVVIYIFYPLIHQVYQNKREFFYFFLVCVMLFTFGNVLLGNTATILSYFFIKFAQKDFHINYFTDFNSFRGIYGYSIGYFMIGGLVGGRFYYLSNIYKRKLTSVATAAMPLCMLGLSFYAVIMSFKNKEMWDLVWEGYDTVFTLINVVSIYVISAQYRSVGWFGKFVKIISENSLGIYLIHIIIGNILTSYFIRLNGSTMLSVNIIYAFVILLCSLLFTVFLKNIPLFKRLVSI